MSAFVCFHCAVVVVVAVIFLSIISIFILHFILNFFYIMSYTERIAAKKLIRRPGRIKKTIKTIEHIIRNDCNNSAQLGRFDRQNVE